MKSENIYFYGIPKLTNFELVIALLVFITLGGYSFYVAIGVLTDSFGNKGLVIIPILGVIITFVSLVDLFFFTYSRNLYFEVYIDRIYFKSWYKKKVIFWDDVKSINLKTEINVFSAFFGLRPVEVVVLYCENGKVESISRRAYRNFESFEAFLQSKMKCKLIEN